MVRGEVTYTVLSSGQSNGDRLALSGLAGPNLGPTSRRTVQFGVKYSGTVYRTVALSASCSLRNSDSAAARRTNQGHSRVRQHQKSQSRFAPTTFDQHHPPTSSFPFHCLHLGPHLLSQIAISFKPLRLSLQSLLLPSSVVTSDFLPLPRLSAVDFSLRVLISLIPETQFLQFYSHLKI